MPRGKTGVVHGTRSCYSRGCRQPECVAAQREYNANLRKRKSNNETTRAPVRALPTPTPPQQPSTGATVEEAVRAEIDGLSTASSRPGLVAVALAHARVLDDPVAISQHASNGHRLAEALEKLRKGSESQVGRLAAVRQISKPA